MDTKRFAVLRTHLESFKKTPVVHFFIRYRRALGLILIVVFLALFGYYIAAHPAIITTLLHINPLIGLFILVLYFGVILTNFVITQVIVRMRGKTLPLKSGLLLTMYSSVVNFFGPLQSGPGVRAVYLKTKVGLRIRDFSLAMILYYAAFAAINASLLFINTWWWLTILGLIVTVGLGIGATYFLKRTSLNKFILIVFIMTLLQILGMVIIYTTELRTIDPASHISLLQGMSYTASANLSLFVSLTPGGIGIREAFLIFTQSLHHIQLSSIIAAGVLDRALYIIFLLIIFVISSLLHLRQTFVIQKRA